jgi:hypothetical protein
MIKIVTDKQLAEIVQRIVHGSEIDDQDTYFKFMEALATVICDFCGGKAGTAGYDEDMLSEGSAYCIAIHHTEEVPEGGGIWTRYDTDVNWDKPEKKGA